MDEERIQKKLDTAKILESLWREGRVTFNQELTLHSECNGLGYLVVDGELVNYHKREYASDTRRPCLYCCGTGRVRRITAEVTVPYEDKEV